MEYRISGIDVIPSGNTRVTMHKLADGSTMPLALPPSHDGTLSEQANHVASIMYAATKAFGELESGRRAAANDKNLSDQGRAEKVKGLREAAQRAATETEAQLATLEASTAVLRDQAFSPPALEIADVNGAFVDQEIRNHARGLTGSAITEYLQSLKGNTRHIEALKRSPVPIRGVSEFVDRLWVESREGSPAAVKVKGLEEASQWGRGTLHTIKRKI